MADDERPSPSAAGGGSGKAPTASAHYAWNESTRKREEELRAAGHVAGPQRVLSHASSAGGASTPKAAGASAWNAAGTYEERNVTVRATEMLKEKLASSRVPASGGRVLVLTSCSTAEGGHATLIFARGKLRLAFEYAKLSIGWRVEPAAGGAALAVGTLTIAEVADSEPDWFEEVAVAPSSLSSLDRGGAVTLVKSCDDGIRGLLREWVEEVKAL